MEESHGGALSAGGELGRLAVAGGRVLRQRYPLVAVTGMTGVGKTALVDLLSGHHTDPGPLPVGSAVLEKRTRRTAKLRGFRFRVVPGENAATRLGALDQVFHDEVVDGVVHVVANGYATGRRAAGTSGPAEAGRERQLAAELEDWTITAHRIAAMAVRRETPTWLIIAVTKADLYPGEVEAVVRSYSPGSGTPFGDSLDQLRALAGAAKLSVDVLAVCAGSGEQAPPGSPVTPAQRKAWLSALEARMAQLSGHV